jgi:hypothetical protein
MDLIREPVLINHPTDTLIIFLPPVFYFYSLVNLQYFDGFSNYLLLLFIKPQTAGHHQLKGLKNILWQFFYI